MPTQKKGFYATRALGLEFGGDAIARTRGMFSSSPDATLDPSLTEQQRYAAGILVLELFVHRKRVVSPKILIDR